MFRRIGERKGRTVTIYVDDVPVAAEAGEPLAAVLVRLQPVWTRTTPVNGNRRAPFCMMGVCYDCIAVVNGEGSVRTCTVPVIEGLRVHRQEGARRVGS